MRNALSAITVGGLANVVVPQGELRERARDAAMTLTRRPAGALGLTYSVFFMASMRVATRAREVKVPDVRGKSVSDASVAFCVSGVSDGA